LRTQADTATGWSAEFAINYAKLGITAGNAETIGLYLGGMDSTPNYWYSWPAAEYPSDLLINPSTWGNASSSDSWLKVPKGWLEGYTVDETGAPVANVGIWLYGGAGKYDMTTSNATGYYNFNNSLLFSTGIPVGDYSLVAMGENLTSETLYATIQEEVTTTLDITLSANLPTEGTKTSAFKDEFANLTAEGITTSSMALVSLEYMGIAGINADGNITATEAGLAEQFFAAMLPPEPAPGNPMSDILIDDTPYLYVADTWNATVDVPAGNVTQIADLTWTIKVNGTATVDVSKTEHIINTTVDFDTEMFISSGEYILPQDWRMDVYDASTTNVTITGWTTITVNPLMDSNLTDAITNESVSITVVKDTDPPADVATELASAVTENDVTLTWTGVDIALPGVEDFDHYNV
jgi:hypothetical protein